MVRTIFERNLSTPERVIRIGLGTFLLGAALRPYAVRRRPFLAGVASLAGVVLLFTGITGSCQIYRAFGVSTYRG